MQDNTEIKKPLQAQGEQSSPKEESPKVVPEAQESERGKEVKKKFPVLVVVIIMGIALLAAGIYAGYSFSKLNQEAENADEQEILEEEIEEEVEEEEEEEMEEEVEEAQRVEFSGDYITAEIPQGWEIIEYEDGYGSDALMEMTDYEGLTGISISTDSGDEILKVYAVMGIGGTNLCSTVAQFSDTPQAYIDEINQRTTDFNVGTTPQEPMPVVVQIGDEDYTAFDFIDFRVRRVGTDFYWNDLDNDNANEFHPLCGLDAAVLNFETLSFVYDSGFGTEGANIYSVEIVGQPSEADLLLLDGVMDSIEVI
jgi:type II secretory pathway pseudopilin PulG